MGSSGAAQSGPSGGSLFFTYIQVSGNSPPDSGAVTNFVLKPDGDTTVSVPMELETVTAGASNGIGIGVTAPTFSAGALTARVRAFYVTNPTGTQKLYVRQIAAEAMTTGQSRQMSLTDASVIEQIGADLVISADGQTIDSVAGGQFRSLAVIEFDATGLVA